MSTKTLTAKNARIGLVIMCKAHPDWGTFRLDQDRNGWVRRGDRGSSMLDEGEFHFWVVVPGTPRRRRRRR